MSVPFIGPSYTLAIRKADVQRSVNLYPIANEVAGGKTGVRLQQIEGLDVFSEADLAVFDIDNDAEPPTPGQAFQLTVTRSGVLTSAVSVDWAATGDVYDGSQGFQRAGADYSGTLAFAASETTKHLDFTFQAIVYLLQCTFVGASSNDTTSGPATVSTAGSGTLTLTVGNAKVTGEKEIRYTAGKLARKTSDSYTVEMLLTEHIKVGATAFEGPALRWRIGGGIAGFTILISQSDPTKFFVETTDGTTTTVLGPYPITGEHFAIQGYPGSGAGGSAGTDVLHDGALVVHSDLNAGAFPDTNAYVQLGPGAGIPGFEMSFAGVRMANSALYDRNGYLPPTSLDSGAANLSATVTLSNPSAGSEINDGIGVMTTT